MAVFSRNGVSFQYPETWNIVPDDYEAGWTVTVSSPATAFFSLTLDMSDTPVNLLVDAALAALTDEYKDIDSDPISETIAGRPAIGHDVEFFAMDLTNTARIRGITTSFGTLLMLCEVNDLETQNSEVLRAISASLTVNDEE